MLEAGKGCCSETTALATSCADLPAAAPPPSAVVAAVAVAAAVAAAAAAAAGSSAVGGGCHGMPRRSPRHVNVCRREFM